MSNEQKPVLMAPEVRSQNRANYEWIMLQSLQNKLDDVIAYPGYLRSESLLSNGTQRIDFAITEGQLIDGQTVGNTEQRLKQNDAFFIERIGVVLIPVDLGAGVAGTPGTQLQRAVARPQHFPSAFAFAANEDSANAFWNGGKLTITQNEKIYCRDLDLYTMQYADTAQESATVRSALDYSRAFQAVTDPMFRLNGQSNVECSIQLPASLNFTQEANVSVYAGIIFKGWRAQNAGVARVAQ